MPNATPICVSASVWSIGAIRSLTGPSNRCRNAAVTRCGPAAMWIGRRLQREPGRDFTSSAGRCRSARRGRRRSTTRAARPLRTAEEQSARVAMQLHAEDVLAVGWKRVHDRHAAAGSERCAFDALQLRRGLRHPVRASLGTAVGIADRQRRHPAGRPQVTVHQRRRECLRVRDVVEAVTDGVGGQERRDVDVDGEQILDRVRIFGAIQPLEGTPARVSGWQRGRAIDARLERFGAARSAPYPPDAARRRGGIMPVRSLRIIFSATRGSSRPSPSNAARESSAGLATIAVTSAAVLLDDAVCSAAAAATGDCAGAACEATGFAVASAGCTGAALAGGAGLVEVVAGFAVCGAGRAA